MYMHIYAPSFFCLFDPRPKFIITKKEYIAPSMLRFPFPVSPAYLFFSVVLLILRLA